MKEREESTEESDVGGAKKEDESVKLGVPASTELTDILNKLVEPETNVLVDDVDEDETAELVGVQHAFMKTSEKTSCTYPAFNMMTIVHNFQR